MSRPTYRSGEEVEIGDTVRIESTDLTVQGKMGVVKTITHHGGNVFTVGVDVGSDKKRGQMFPDELEYLP